MDTDKNVLSRREVIKIAGQAAVAAAAAKLITSPNPASGKAYAQVAPGSIGVALVGGAHIHTPQYSGAIKNRKSLNVKYVWDHDAARADKYAKELGCNAVPDLHTIWSDPQIAAVIICSETNRHHDLVLAAAQAKKHMFVEKPLGSSAKESFAMASAIEKANLLFNTGYFMRTAREHIFLKDQVAKGSFGKITRVRGSNCHSGSLGGWFDTDYRWMADPKIAGVGAFGDLGTHSLDILMWLMGGIDAATADIMTVTNRYPGCDESGEALLKFQNGAAGTLAAGWVDVDNPVSLLISGTEGHATIINNRLFFKSSKVDHADGRTPWTDLPPGTPPPIQQFLDAVEGKPHEFLVKPSEAAARVAVMEAAYKGAQTQSWVKVAQG
jgi:predicted dehydrogenase